MDNSSWNIFSKQANKLFALSVASFYFARAEFDFVEKKNSIQFLEYIEWLFE